MAAAHGGTRTNALVAAGAAAFVMCGLLLDNDPSARGRIVSGVGFLGAGVIFKDGARVRGLNTAATIWCSAAIGALTGLGSFHLALALAQAVLFTNMVLRPLAYRLHPVLPEANPAETLYELKLDCKVSAAAHVRALLNIRVRRISEAFNLQLRVEKRYIGFHQTRPNKLISRVVSLDIQAEDLNGDMAR
jgi:putative Mg2+ transporter-C (MgtC) family protein